VSPGSLDLRLYARLLREARSCWSYITLVFVLSLLATPLALLAPYPLKLAVDSVIGSQPVPSLLTQLLPDAATSSDTAVLAVCAALFVAVALATQLQQLGTFVIGTYAGEKVLLAFRARLFRHVQRLSLAYHDTHGTADSVYRIQYDAPAIQWLVVYGVTPFVTAVLTFAGMIAVTAAIDRELALIALAVSPLLLAVTWCSKRRLRRQWRTTKDLESSALAVIQEALTSLRVVKAFAQEEHESERFVSRSGEGMRARIRVAVEEASLGLAVGLTTAAGTAAVLVVGVQHVLAGSLTLGSLLLVMGYVTQLYVPLQAISKSVAGLQASLTSAERAFTLLDRPPDVPELAHALPVDRVAGRISFQGVSFAYDRRRPVLQDISFTVEAGTSLAIAGATGAGKTTLVSLLSRFYDPTHGQILIDGVDLRRYRLADLRRQFAVVLQEPVLFSTSVYENIAYARPGATTREIVAAAEAANAHTFISALPDGYGTRVGERGMQLSGGQRQRISIARAFLKDAPILILDEPTSSIDAATEALILSAMARLAEGRTTLVIAHRPSTLALCTSRIELADGRLVTKQSPRHARRTELLRTP
jgi:ATP-binding cassette subfamily B protein